MQADTPWSKKNTQKLPLMSILYRLGLLVPVFSENAQKLCGPCKVTCGSEKSINDDVNYTLTLSAHMYFSITYEHIYVKPDTSRTNTKFVSTELPSFLCLFLCSFEHGWYNWQK